MADQSKIQESKKMKEQVRTQMAKGVLPSGGESLSASIVKFRSKKRQRKLEEKRAVEAKPQERTLGDKA